MLSWGVSKNIENSLKYFLETEISADAIQDINGDLITVRIGRKNDNDWSLPCIAIYKNSETNDKPFVGSNQTDDRHLIIIDIFAENDGERQDLADWMTAKITDGWRYYTYTVNINTPLNPTKVATGWVSINFLTNTKVELGQNVALFDQNKHRISVNAWVS